MTPLPETPAAPSPPDEPRRVLDAAAIERALRRMAGELVERNRAAGDLERLAVVGIQTRGVEVARRLAENVADLLHSSQRFPHPAFGALDISLHRDDLRQREPRALIASVQATDLPLDLDDRAVVLTDDVFFTGRSVRAALDALGAYGRPRNVQLAVLVDRDGHRQLPIRPDYAGTSVSTLPAERVRVRFAALDGIGDGVWIVGP